MRFQLTLTQYLIYLFLAIFILNSCRKNLEEEKTFNENTSIEKYIASQKWTYSKVNGLYHVVRKPSFGYQALVGDTVEFWYSAYTLNGKVFDTNVKDIAKAAKLDTLIRSFNPISTIVGKGNLIDGVDEGLLQIREREIATILFSSSLGYGNNAIGPVPEWSPLAYDIELIKVNGISIQEEKSYISSLNLEAEGYSSDTSGLYLKKISLGLEGSSPTINDTIYGWYNGTLSDGTVIDELETENKQIVLLNSDIPEGVKLGFMLTKINGITDLVLPSYLGFGNKGNELVKPYQTIFYRIRLDSIK